MLVPAKFHHNCQALLAAVSVNELKVTGMIALVFKIFAHFVADQTVSVEGLAILVIFLNKVFQGKYFKENANYKSTKNSS